MISTTVRGVHNGSLGKEKKNGVTDKWNRAITGTTEVSSERASFERHSLIVLSSLAARGGRPRPSPSPGRPATAAAPPPVRPVLFPKKIV
ncbi:hypothetical protein EVAR_28358_1 [Eumeta japonica]|uniref:Uncharacterized protein n=1 Tax=Eumeta variegata TaxID=151549 RepID=A0A4C1V8G2_EUMVA|nr:hypothetical protein EVAR_28358_1 [Eumeta japonica]